MIVFMSFSSGKLYKFVLKPVLFKFSPDAVHEGMIKTGHFMQRFSIFRWFMRTVLAYKSEKLNISMFGLNFQNPIGLSAGLDKDAKIVRVSKAIGFGFSECGSITHGSYEGNPQPWYTRLPKSKSIIVNSGLRSEGAVAVNKRVRAYPKDIFVDFPLNISIAKTNSSNANTCELGIKDYVSSLKLWEKEGGANLYTINISCPNTFGGEPFTDTESLDKLLSAIDECKVSKPIFIKMPIDKSWDEFESLLEVCAKHNIQGITLGNLYKNRETVTLKDTYDQNVKGNFSGKPCWETSNDLLEKSYAKYKDRFVFSGVGGVFSAEDAYVKIKLGATFVELVTGLIFEGPTLIGQINRGLVKLLEKDGYKSIGEAVGSGNKYVKERGK